MKKKMDLASFDVYKYLKWNFFKDANTSYLIIDSATYREASIQFPFRNFFYGIGLTHSGKDRVKIANRTYEIQKGSLILIGPGIVSQWMNDSHAPTDTILFTDALFKNSLQAAFLSSLPFFLPGGNHVITLSDEEYEKMKMLFQSVKQFKNDADIITGLTYSVLMLSKKAHDLEASHKFNSFTRKEKIVREFKCLAATHYLKNRNVNFYAKQMNITPKYLSEVLLSETGKPAKSLIDDIVFLEAKSLLRQTTMSVQEIALWLGYADASYFAKAFKNKEALTPLEYRKQ